MTPARDPGYREFLHALHDRPVKFPEHRAIVLISLCSQGAATSCSHPGREGPAETSFRRFQAYS
jgi:hypothetical protein